MSKQKLEMVYLKRDIFSWLVEALRRELMHGDKDYNANKALTEKWLGLGMPSTYKQIVAEGYMVPVHPPITPKVEAWYKLTEKGARVVQFWLDQGITLSNFNTFYPDHRIPIEIPVSILGEENDK